MLRHGEGHMSIGIFIILELLAFVDLYILNTRQLSRYKMI